MTALLLSLIAYSIGVAVCYGWCLADPRWSRQDALWFSWGWPLWVTALVVVGPFALIADVTKDAVINRRHRAKVSIKDPLQ